MEINSDVTLYASWARDRRPATPTTGDDSESSTYVAVDRPIGPGGGGGITGPTVPPIIPPSLDKQNPLMYTIGSIPYYYMYAEIDRDPS